MPTGVVCQTKGGAGKTTSAITIATRLAARGYSVALIDGDSNQHMKFWSQGTNPVPENIELFVDVTTRKMIDTIESAERKFQFVIVDLAGVEHEINEHAISRADLVIVPFGAAGLDCFEAVRVMEATKKVQNKQGSSIPMVGLFTKTHPTIVTKKERKYGKQMRDAGLQILTSQMNAREVFKSLIENGGGLEDQTEHTEEDRNKAIKDADLLTTEILKLFKQLEHKRAA